MHKGIGVGRAGLRMRILSPGLDGVGRWGKRELEIKIKERGRWGEETYCAGGVRI